MLCATGSDHLVGFPPVFRDFLVLEGPKLHIAFRWDLVWMELTSSLHLTVTFSLMCIAFIIKMVCPWGLSIRTIKSFSAKFLSSHSVLCWYCCLRCFCCMFKSLINLYWTLVITFWLSAKRPFPELQFYTPGFQASLQIFCHQQNFWWSICLIFQVIDEDIKHYQSKYQPLRNATCDSCQFHFEHELLPFQMNNLVSFSPALQSVSQFE